MIGSLLPDIDAPDAAIRHKRIRGKEFKDLENLTVLNPIIAKLTDVMLIPWFYLLRVSNSELNTKHRGIVHTMFGVVFIFYSWVLLFGLIIGVSFYYYQNDWTLALIFPLGLAIGSFLHLLEDSYTVSGVRWLYPTKNFLVLGKIKTIGRYSPAYKKLGMREKNNNITTYFLICTVSIFFLLPDLIHTVGATIGEVLLGGLIFGVRVER